MNKRLKILSILIALILLQNISINALVFAEAGDNLLQNGDFEAGLTGWNIIESSESVVELGSGWDYTTGSGKMANIYGGLPYSATLDQTAADLEEGLYTLKAYIRGNGEPEKIELFANNDDEEETLDALDGFTADTWQEITLENIRVSGGRCTVGICVAGKANTWVGLDDVSFCKTGEIGIINGDFESETLEPWHVTQSGDGIVTIPEGWDHTGNGRMLNLWYAEPYTATVNQDVYGLKDGLYTLQLYINGNGNPNGVTVFANNRSLNALDGFSPDSWNLNTIENIPVSDGTCQLIFEIDGKANTWVGIDDVTLVRSGDIDVQDGDFESGTLDYWDVIQSVSGIVGNTAEWDHTFGNVEGEGHKLNVWYGSAYSATVSQTVYGVVDGIYTLEVYINASGGPDSVTMFARNYGDEELSVDLTNSANAWNIKQLENIQITDGKCEVGIHIEGTGGTWIGLDDVHLIKTADLYSPPDLYPTDLNNDCVTNVKDLAYAVYYLGSAAGDVNWQNAEEADMNDNDIIDLGDLKIICAEILEQ